MEAFRYRRFRPVPAAANAGESAPLASLSREDRAIVEQALPYTMTGVVRLQALIDAVRYLVRSGLEGDFVECGVWRGGSVLAMIETLRQMDAEPRHIWLYDTFEGMTAPTEHDTSRFEPPAVETWRDAHARHEQPWGDLFGGHIFDQRSVRETLVATGYPSEHLHLIKGPVDETLPRCMSKAEFSLVRLDTDWYESTRHELTHLYPRLQTGGVLIIDDYGHFDGARRAVDEYFAVHPPVLLNRIDYTGRLAIKL